MKILVTGSKGQLGNELQVIAREHSDITFVFTDFEELDITDRNAVSRLLSEHRPLWIINCAAYTAVDKAEVEPEKAMLLNADGPGILAREGIATGSRLIQVSTDYVFDGRNHQPYKVDDPINPLGVYAISKARGEANIQDISASAIILRTSWLYSQFGNNFVKTIRKAGRERDELRVVADQVGSPTWANDLATAIIGLISSNADAGIYHYANEGVCSWFDFAKAVIELSGINCRVTATDTAGYPLPAPRPFYSVLDKSRYKQSTGQTIPYWRDSLKKCIALLNEQS